MERRNFLMKTAAAGVAAGLALAGCTTTTESGAHADPAARRHDIDSDVDATLTRLYTTQPNSRELVSRARGVLVFPSVVAAGLFVGGQYGEGALRVAGRTTGYYSMASGSIGLQAGAQSKAVIYLFMTAGALDKLRSTRGWSVGGDASVAVLKVGANGDLDTNTATAPVDVIVMTNAGLMANLSLEGTKVSRLDL